MEPMASVREEDRRNAGSGQRLAQVLFPGLKDLRETDWVKSSEFVFISVWSGVKGEDVWPFEVHKLVACHYCPVFAAAFNSDLVEGRTRSYSFDDLDPELFKPFVCWMYDLNHKTKQQLTTKFVDSQPKYANPLKKTAVVLATDEQSAEHHKLVSLWILGDRLRTPRFQNYVMTKLKIQLSVSLSTNWMAYAYENTTAGSALRHLAVDICMYGLTPKHKIEYAAELPHELLIEVSCSSVLKRKRTQRVSSKYTYNHKRLISNYLVSED